MEQVFFNETVHPDGTLSLPAFAMRGLGYEPGDEVTVTIPTSQYLCDCLHNQLFIGRICSDTSCLEYTCNGEKLNIPASFLAKAAIPMDGNITVLAADGALLIVATEEMLEELPIELCSVLNDLGISPVTLFSDIREAVQ